MKTTNSQRGEVSVEFIQLDGDYVAIEVAVLNDFREKLSLYVDTEKFNFAKNGLTLKVVVPAKQISNASYLRIGNGNDTDKIDITFGKFSGLSIRVARSYRRIGRYLFRPHASGLRIHSYSWYRHVFFELRYSIQLVLAGKKAAFYRLAYWCSKPMLSNRKIWLLSDRPYTAGDNADYLFRYMALRNDLPHGVVPIFALNKNHERFTELKRYGKVVHFGSFRYRMYAMHAVKRISSHFDEYIINPLGGGELCYDLYNFEYVYLEHGVLTSDSSAQFGRLVRNASLITAAAMSEKDAIISNKEYGYDESIVRVTGHARFDGLDATKTRKKIILMPTWREAIAGQADTPRLGIPKQFRQYSPDFISTDYYHFYNSLLTDEKLLKALERYDYTVQFYIHPSLGAQWKDFDTNKYVKVMQPPHDYETALAEGALLITDYSGVAFDFAYMHKPVIYAQFDEDVFYKSHYYAKGYFSFAANGFGPVTHTLRETVEFIIETLKRDCQMSDEYKKRSNSFFEYHDKNNTKRIYEAIRRMPEV